MRVPGCPGTREGTAKFKYSDRALAPRVSLTKCIRKQASERRTRSGRRTHTRYAHARTRLSADQLARIRSSVPPSRPPCRDRPISRPVSRYLSVPLVPPPPGHLDGRYVAAWVARLQGCFKIHPTRRTRALPSPRRFVSSLSTLPSLHACEPLHTQGRRS